jgi:CheY-like chemotaxis protein
MSYGSTGQKPTMLILYLEPSIEHLMWEVLTLDGYPTRTTRSSAEALRFLGSLREICIVLMDNVQVSEQAHLFLAALRAHPQLYRRVRTIGLAAMDYEWVQTRAEVGHLDGYIRMPFDIEQFLGPIEALARASQSRERRVWGGGSEACHSLTLRDSMRRAGGPSGGGTSPLPSQTRRRPSRPARRRRPLPWRPPACRRPDQSHRRRPRRPTR